MVAPGGYIQESTATAVAQGWLDLTLPGHNLYVLAQSVEPQPVVPWKDPLANQLPKYHKSHPVWLAAPCKWLLLAWLCDLHILENKKVYSGINHDSELLAQGANAKRLNVAINKRWCEAAMSSRPLPLSEGAQTSERWIIRPTLSSWAWWFCKFCPFEQGTGGQTQLTHQAGQPPLCGKSPRAARSGSKKIPAAHFDTKRQQHFAGIRAAVPAQFLLLAQLAEENNWLLKSKIQSQYVLVGKEESIIYFFFIQIIICNFDHF